MPRTPKAVRQKLESAESLAAELTERLAASEKKLAAMQQAAMTAETNELTLHRRLSPYLDAEIANRDAEIKELTQKLEEAGNSLEADADALESMMGDLSGK